MKQTWPRLACAGVLALLPLFASAQYGWVDGKGMRVYSDRPPPPGTPRERIFKAPRGVDLQPLQAEPAPAASPAEKPAEKPKAASLADREADFRKRAAQRELDEKKAAEEASEKVAKEENCALARENEHALSSGIRLAQIGANGEKSYIGDEERARRLKRAQDVLKSCR